MAAWIPEATNIAMLDGNFNVLVNDRFGRDRPRGQHPWRPEFRRAPLLSTPNRFQSQAPGLGRAPLLRTPHYGGPRGAPTIRPGYPVHDDDSHHDGGTAGGPRGAPTIRHGYPVHDDDSHHDGGTAGDPRGAPTIRPGYPVHDDDSHHDGGTAGDPRGAPTIRPGYPVHDDDSHHDGGTAVPEDDAMGPRADCITETPQVRVAMQLQQETSADSEDKRHYNCTACNLDFLSLHSFNLHKNSLSHKAQVFGKNDNVGNTSSQRVASVATGSIEDEGTDETADDWSKCKPCALTFKDYDAYMRHIRSMGHMQKMAENTQQSQCSPRPKPQPPSQPVVQPNPDSASQIDPKEQTPPEDLEQENVTDEEEDWSYCEACQMKFTVYNVYMRHIKSIGHIQKMAVYPQQSPIQPGPNSRPKWPPVPQAQPGPESQPKSVSQSGPIHQTSQADPEQENATDEDEDWSYCGACQMKFTVYNSYLMHIRGIVHARRVEELKQNKPIIPGEANSNMRTDPYKRIGPVGATATKDRPEAVRPDQDTKRTGLTNEFYCDICHKDFNTDKSLLMHRNETYHRLMASYIDAKQAALKQAPLEQAEVEEQGVGGEPASQDYNYMEMGPSSAWQHTQQTYKKVYLKKEDMHEAAKDEDAEDTDGKKPQKPGLRLFELSEEETPHVQRKKKQKPLATVYSPEDYHLEMSCNQDAGEEYEEVAMTEDGDFLCTVCNAACNSVNSYKAHITGQKHAKKLKQLAVTPMDESIAGISTDQVLSNYEAFGDVENPQCLGQVHVDNYMKPLVGLQYVIECQSSNKTLMYMCEICEAKMNVNQLFHHLEGFKHKRRFFKCNFPEKHQRLCAFNKPRAVLSILADEYSHEVESLHGRRKLRVRIQLSGGLVHQYKNHPNRVDLQDNSVWLEFKFDDEPIDESWKSAVEELNPFYARMKAKLDSMKDMDPKKLVKLAEKEDWGPDPVATWIQPLHGTKPSKGRGRGRGNDMQVPVRGRGRGDGWQGRGRGRGRGSQLPGQGRGRGRGWQMTDMAGYLETSQYPEESYEPPRQNPYNMHLTDPGHPFTRGHESKYPRPLDNSQLPATRLIGAADYGRYPRPPDSFQPPATRSIGAADYGRYPDYRPPQSAYDPLRLKESSRHSYYSGRAAPDPYSHSMDPRKEEPCARAAASAVSQADRYSYSTKARVPYASHPHSEQAATAAALKRVVVYDYENAPVAKKISLEEYSDSPYVRPSMDYYLAKRRATTATTTQDDSPCATSTRPPAASSSTNSAATSPYLLPSSSSGGSGVPSVSKPSGGSNFSMPPGDSNSSNPSDTTSMLQAMASCIVNNEADADIALQVSNTLTKALLQYRIKNVMHKNEAPAEGKSKD